jgi:hypothetical protein
MIPITQGCFAPLGCDISSLQDEEIITSTTDKFDFHHMIIYITNPLRELITFG